MGPPPAPRRLGVDGWGTGTHEAQSADLERGSQGGWWRVASGWGGVAPGWDVCNIFRLPSYVRLDRIRWTVDGRNGSPVKTSLLEWNVIKSVISVDRVTKRFSDHTAVKQFSLEVPQGAVFGLLGPNGAGKTTTIRMIMDIIRPDEGRVTLFGGAGTGRDLSARIGFLPEERGLYPKMQVLGQLAFLAEIKGLPRGDALRRGREWLERLGLGEWAEKKVEDLSKGMQQKVQFIGTLMHDPDLVILDEPFSGLDPVNTKAMKDVVVDFARRKKIKLLSLSWKNATISPDLIFRCSLTLSGNVVEKDTEILDVSRISRLLFMHFTILSR